jgi:phage tail-like protein
VTGLNEGMTDTIEQPDGGSPVVHKIASGVIKFDTLVVERNMDGSRFDQFFQDYFADMFQLNGASAGSSKRRNCAVLKLENGNEVLRFAVYGAWVKSSKFADLEAGSTNLFKQTVELEHDGLERVS